MSGQARSPGPSDGPGDPHGPIGYQPEYSATAAIRKSVRDVLDTLLFESVVILLVCVYAVIMFIDLTLDNNKDVDPPECIITDLSDIRKNETLMNLCSMTAERDWLYYLDLIFLSIFMVEIMVRIFGFGKEFFEDGIQALDAFVVTLSFIFALVPEDLLTSVSFLNVLRVIRLLRLAVIINKLQVSRDKATMRSKRAMWARLGAPVERVLSFLTQFRSRQALKKDQENIDWMMEIIAGEDLYAVAAFDEDALLGMAGGNESNAAEMAKYLSLETGLAKRKPSNDEGADGEIMQEEVVTKTKTRRPSQASNSLSLWVGTAIATPNLSRKLQKLLSQDTAWSFDIFDFEQVCQQLPEPGVGQSATLIGYFLLEQHGVLDALEIERAKMLAWLTAVDAGYSRTNAYHNNLHAADVCANMDYFLRQSNFARLLSPVDILSSIIAALVHDMAHPGLNNTFLEATKHDLAITYNDVSVLENHHVAAAFKLLKQKDCDWTKSMSTDDYKDMRETVIQMVLGTDMRAHFEYLTKFKSKQAGEGFTGTLERKDMRLLLTVALHAADIANPAKREIIATTWAKRSMIEFFRQGDKEAELGLPVSPFMDRTKAPLSATIVNCQIGFINVLVRPLLAEWAAFLGDAAERDMILTLDQTLRMWETQGNKIIESWGNFATVKADGAAAATAAAAKGGASKAVDSRTTGDKGKANVAASPSKVKQNV